MVLEKQDAEHAQGSGTAMAGLRDQDEGMIRDGIIVPDRQGVTRLVDRGDQFARLACLELIAGLWWDRAREQRCSCQRHVNRSMEGHGEVE